MKSNSLLVYWDYESSLWAFDDVRHGLVSEPFIMGMSEILSYAVMDIDNARDGFLMFFSLNPITAKDYVLEKLREENGGCWYRLKGTKLEGWLCPAMYHYFSSSPIKIHVTVKGLD